MVILTILFVILFLYGGVGLLLNLFKAKTEDGVLIVLPFKLPAFFVGLFGAIIVSLITRIGGQDVGIIISPSGVKDAELHTGWHIVYPWQNVYRMDKTVWVYTCAQASDEGAKPNADAIWAPTADGIKMGFDVSYSWRIDPNEASWIYANVSENDGGGTGRYLWLEENVIRVKLKSVMGLTVSEFTPVDAYGPKRQEIQDIVTKRMKEELKSFKIIGENADIREVYYNTDYEKAINAKKLAEQEVMRLVEVTRQKVELEKQETINKNIAIIKAEGEAKSLQIKGTSISNNPKIIQLEWINRWDGKLPVTMMGQTDGIIVNMNN